MRMPWEAREIIIGALVTEIVEKEERIELAGFAKAKPAMQLYARAFHGRRGLNDALNWS